MNKYGKTISFGDKIFARVSRNGQTIYNFVSEKVANMADLVSQLRRAMRNIQGLVILHIRNYDQGWGEERPLMLYPEKRLSVNPLEGNFNIGQSAQEPARRMLFPWETH